MLGQWASLVTGGVGLVLAAIVFGHYNQGKRLHNLIWALGLLCGAVAGLLDFVAHLLGEWHPELYLVFLLTALVLPGLFGVGTLYLLYRPLAGHALLALVTMLGVGLLFALLSAATTPAAPGAPFALPETARGISRSIGYTGGLVMLLGGIYSWLAQKKGYAGLIALSALLFMVSGYSSAKGLPGVYYGLQAAAMLLLFASVSLAARAQRDAHESQSVLS